MSTETIIGLLATIISTFITIGSAIFTFLKARETKKSAEDAKAVLGRVSFVHLLEPLRRCQEEARKLPTSLEPARGVNVNGILKKMRGIFDEILSSPLLVGDNEYIRDKLREAQNLLMQYEKNYSQGKANDSEDYIDPHTIRSLLQDVLAEIGSKFILD